MRAEDQIVFEGERGYVLSLGVFGYEYPEDSSGTDADWLEASCEFKGGPNLNVVATAPLSLRAPELEGLNEELAGLLDGHRRTASLEHIEQQLEFELAVQDDGSIQAAGYLDDGIQLKVEFRQVVISRDALVKARQQLAAVVANYPNRP